MTRIHLENVWLYIYIDTLTRICGSYTNAILTYKKKITHNSVTKLSLEGTMWSRFEHMVIKIPVMWIPKYFFNRYLKDRSLNETHQSILY